MASTRRQALTEVKPSKDKERETHAGLWLDKYIQSVLKEDKGAKQKLVREVAEELGEPQEYKDFFERYQEGLKAIGAELRTAQTRGRMVLGLGGEGVLETSLTLHRTYGVPYIPGSALKGLASRYAHLRLEGEAWRRNLAKFYRGEAQRALFGTTEEGGAVLFLDALPLPGKWRLLPDVMTPHHADYYTRDKPPADWGSPTPVPFLSVHGTFLLALAPAPGVKDPRPWLKAAWQILEWALAEEGIGGKTGSGYGRMVLEDPPKPKPSPVLEGLLIKIQGLSRSYKSLEAFLEGHADLLQKLNPTEAQQVREALEEKGLLQGMALKDLKQAAKRKEALRQSLERLGL